MTVLGVIPVWVIFPVYRLRAIVWLACHEDSASLVRVTTVSEADCGAPYLPAIIRPSHYLSMATCTECEAEMDVDEFDVDRGDQLSCPECGANLEVVSLSPVELDVVSDDDDDDDKEEDGVGGGDADSADDDEWDE